MSGGTDTTLHCEDGMEHGVGGVDFFEGGHFRSEAQQWHVYQTYNQVRFAHILVLQQLLSFFMVSIY